VRNLRGDSPLPLAGDVHTCGLIYARNGSRHSVLRRDRPRPTATESLRPDLTVEVRSEISSTMATASVAGARFLRMTTILGHLGWPSSAWYRQSLYGPRRALDPTTRKLVDDLVDDVT
jgi:hypothetical protein